MNLSNTDILRAHGQALIDLLNEANILAEKHQDTKSIIDDRRLVEILTKDPLSLYSPDETEFDRVHQILSDYEDDARKYHEISLDESLNPVGIEDLIVKVCYKMELSQRGEGPGKNITIGVHPLTIRVTALMYADMRKANSDDCLGPNWLQPSIEIENQKEKSQLFFNKIIHDLPGFAMNTYTAKNSNGDKTSEIGLFNKYNEFSFQLRIKLPNTSYNSPSSIVITDDGLIIPKCPESYLASKIGSRIENLFEHDLIKGLGLTVDSYHQLDDFSCVKFGKTSLEDIKIEKSPEDWLLKI